MHFQEWYPGKAMEETRRKESVNRLEREKKPLHKMYVFC